MRPGSEALLVQLVSERLRRLGLDPMRIDARDLEQLARDEAERPMDSATLLLHAGRLYRPPPEAA